jgi:hypothetical protein
VVGVCVAHTDGCYCAHGLRHFPIHIQVMDKRRTKLDKPMILCYLLWIVLLGNGVEICANHMETVEEATARLCRASANTFSTVIPYT